MCFCNNGQSDCFLWVTVYGDGAIAYRRSLDG